MSKIDPKEQQTQIHNYQQLIQQQNTLLLSTVSKQAKPECSYAPFVRDSQGVFYIFVSELAVHTNNMLESGSASVMFIQAENETQNLFARERVVFDCTVTEIEQSNECFNSLLQQLKQRCGDTVELLRSLSDFHLLALKPVRGKYVAGFGKAFNIKLSDDTLK